MVLYFVAYIYRPDRFTFSMRNNLQLKMFETKWGPHLLNKYSLLQMHFANALKIISFIQKMNNLTCFSKS